MMRILACGGRDFTDILLLRRVLDAAHAEQPVSLLIHGDASGADQLAAGWANSRGIRCRAVPAEWKLYGRKAGPIRNAKMLEEKPDLVIAFPGGRGTADMVRQAKSAGVCVKEVT